jgi:hypothetical protein
MLSSFSFIACSSSRNAAWIVGEILCPPATLLTIEGTDLQLVGDSREHTSERRNDTHVS